MLLYSADVRNFYHQLCPLAELNRDSFSFYKYVYKLYISMLYFDTSHLYECKYFSLLILYYYYFFTHSTLHLPDGRREYVIPSLLK